MTQREAMMALVEGKRIYNELGGCYWLDGQGRLWYSPWSGTEFPNCMFGDIVSQEDSKGDAEQVDKKEDEEIWIR